MSDYNSLIPLYNQIDLPVNILDYIFQFINEENDIYHIKYGKKHKILEKHINPHPKCIDMVLNHKQVNKVIYICEAQYEEEDYMQLEVAYYIEAFTLYIPTVGYVNLIYRYKSVFQYTLEQIYKLEKEHKRIQYK